MTPSAQDIIAATAKVFEVTTGALIGRGRSKHLVRARWVAAHLLRHIPIPASGIQRSAVLIGKTLGGRDHATVLHGLTQMRDELTGNAEYARGLACVRAELGLPEKEPA